jgi:hypothetical protein
VAEGVRVPRLAVEEVKRRGPVVVPPVLDADRVPVVVVGVLLRRFPGRPLARDPARDEVAVVVDYLDFVALRLRGRSVPEGRRREERPVREASEPEQLDGLIRLGNGVVSQIIE